jgi:hypothetical protein
LSRRLWVSLACLLAVPLLVAGLALPAAGQGLRSVIESRDRLFPEVGAGVTAMKRDSSGHYYILAKPESVISVYGSDGTLIGRIPNAKSNGATIRYAADIDFTPEGLLVVADRGANAILVFSPDGAFVSRTPIAEPTSVVALPDGQYAVTTLTSKRLVEVIDQRGRVMRSFGDPANVPGQSEQSQDQQPNKEPLVNTGWISGDSSGAIYYAFTAVPDPTVRKYDKLGYLGYEATIPQHVFGEAPTQPNNRVEVTLGFSDVSFSQQTSGFLTIGSANDVKFGGGVGTGLGQELRSGVGFGQVIQQQTNPSAFGGGPLGATFSGEASSQGTNFQMGLGRMSGTGGRGRHSGFGSISDQSNSQGAALHFSTSGDDSGDSALDQGGYSFDPNNMTAQLQSGPFGNDNFNTADPTGVGAYNGTQPGLAPGGLPGSFVLGTQDPFFRRPGFGGTNGSNGSTGTSGAPGTAAAGEKPGPTGSHSPGGATHPGNNFSHFGGYHGRFGDNSFSFTSTMRVNLGDLGRVSAFDKPIITAMAADPETHEIWAGIGDTLVHFSKDGDPIGIYYLVLGGSTPLKPVAVLVEPDRFLIAADPWGIFEFARPDKPQSPPKQTGVVPQVVSQPQ